MSEDGDTYVIQAGPEFKVLGKNSLNEMTLATPAVARGSLIIRTASKLYRIARSSVGGFDFQLRTRVVFGDGALARLGELARELSFTRTLVVADPGIVSVGLAQRARGAARRGRHLRRTSSKISAPTPTRRWSSPAGWAGGGVRASIVAVGGASRSTAPRGSTSSSPTAARCATTAASAEGRKADAAIDRRADHRRYPATKRSRTR